MKPLASVMSHIKSVWSDLEEDERIILGVLYDEFPNVISQEKIINVLRNSNVLLGAHPKYEKRWVGKLASTTRALRSVLENLRKKHHIPVCGGGEGHWLPKDDADLREYMEALKSKSYATAASHIETFERLAAVWSPELLVVRNVGNWQGDPTTGWSVKQQPEPPHAPHKEENTSSRRFSHNLPTRCVDL